MNKTQVTIKALSVMFKMYGRESNAEVLTAFANGLNDLKIEVVGYAISEATKNEKFCPTLAVLREYAEKAPVKANSPRS